jgi:poly(A) polymerase
VTRSPAALRRARAVEVARVLRDAGHTAYLCGGAVRDELLGREPKDYDVATSAPPDQGVRLFPRAVLVGARFGVLVVPAEEPGQGDVEVATFRDDGLYVDGRRPESVRFSDPERDARRRDFTVNGLFLDPFDGTVHDFVEGRRDLAARLIRAIGDPEARFREDHLRILRAVRQAAELGFAVEPRTWQAVGDLAPLLDDVSAERVRDELLKLLRTARGRGLRLLRRSGLLARLLPEIEAMADVEQPAPYHPEGDVFVHTCLVLDGLRLDEAKGDPDVETDLVLAALLHDVAKPPTWSQDPDGRIRFNGHDALGVTMSEALLERLRLPRRTVDRVGALVGGHMRIASAPAMRTSRLRRFLADEDVALHLALHEADCGASHGARDVLEFCRARLEEYGREPAVPPPLLTGKDLIARGYAPGPRMGEILRWVQDEQLEGRLGSPEDAAREVRRRFPPDAEEMQSPPDA